MKDLTVCIVAQADSAHAIKWSNALDEVGVRVVLLSPSLVRVNGSLSPRVSVRFLGVDGKHFYHKPPVTKTLLYWVRLRRLLREIRPDVVHLHFMPAAYTNLLFWRGIDNLVISVWGSDIISDKDDTHTRRGWYKSALLGQARAITATTKYLADEARRYLSNNKPIAVIPFGVDLRMFVPKPAPRGRDPLIRIGFCKHLEPKYGPLVLIRAFALALQRVPNLELVVCGRGTLEADARELCERLGVNDKVEFTGFVDHDRIPDLLNGFDIFAMPSVSVSETFGVAAVEAQACGVPVVASDLPGIREAVIADQTALLVPAGDVKSLSEAIVALATNPDRRIALGERGAQHVRQEFDIRQGALTFVELYREVVP